MLRKLIAAFAFAASLGSLGAAAPPPVPATSTVYFAEEQPGIARFGDDAGSIRAMVDSLVIATTGQTELGKAWRSLVAPTDRVGIKVSTAGGRGFSTHPAIVAAIGAGLESAGVPRDHIVIWDRNAEDLRAAGFLPQPERYTVRAIDPPRGFDRDAVITGSVLGKLMWGDLLFVEKQRVTIGKPKSEGDQLSSNSYLARIVSREVTKIINLPVLSDERGCAVAGAIYNMSLPNVDNWRRFTQTEGSAAASPAEIYGDDRIAPKVVLHLMDGLVAQFAAGPDFNPNYSVPHHTLYASKDPVALDSVALRKIEEWRAQAKLTSLAPRGAWLKDAASMGLGNAAEESIALRQIEPAR